MHPCYNDHPTTAYGNNRCLFLVPYKTLKSSALASEEFLDVRAGGITVLVKVNNNPTFIVRLTTRK
jgi:hypothetical protein